MSDLPYRKKIMQEKAKWYISSLLTVPQMVMQTFKKAIIDKRRSKLEIDPFKSYVHFQAPITSVVKIKMEVWDKCDA